MKNKNAITIFDVLRIRQIKRMISDPDYARNRAIEYGEQHGAWVAEYHMWNGIDNNRAKAAFDNANRYLKRMQNYAKSARILHLAEHYPEGLDYES